MNNKDLDVQEIAKFLNGKMSLQETEGFKEKLKIKKNEDLVKQYIVAKQLLDIETEDFNSEEAFERFISKKNKIPKTKNVFLFKKAQSLFKYAALFLGPIMLFFLFKIYNKSDINNTFNNDITLELNDGSINVINENDSQKIVDQKTGNVVGIQNKTKLLYNYSLDTIKNLANEVEINVVKVPRGKRFEIVLSDGTHINLNSESSIKYPVLFAEEGERVVELTGEAYFKVAKDKKRPFLVKTNDIRTQVLGTEFNITAYNNDAFSKVVLVEGSVRVYRGSADIDDTGVLLEPGEKAVFSKAESKIKMSNAIIQNHIAWIDGILLFENESFKTISRKLERFYNVAINNSYVSFDDEKFTGQFDVESIEEVFNTFKKNTPFNYTIENDKININQIKYVEP